MWRYPALQSVGVKELGIKLHAHFKHIRNGF